MTQIGVEFVSRLFPVYLLSRQKVHHAVFQLAISCCQLTGRNISRFALAIYSSAGDSTNCVHFVMLPIQRGCCVCILYISGGVATRSLLNKTNMLYEAAPCRGLIIIYPYVTHTRP